MVGRYGRRGRRARRKYYLLAIFRTGLISDYSLLKEVQWLWHLISMDARLIHSFLFRLIPIFCHHPFHIHFLNFCSYSQAVEEEDVEGDNEGVSYSFTSLLHFFSFFTWAGLTGLARFQRFRLAFKSFVKCLMSSYEKAGWLGPRGLGFSNRDLVKRARKFCHMNTSPRLPGWKRQEFDGPDGIVLLCPLYFPHHKHPI